MQIQRIDLEADIEGSVGNASTGIFPPTQPAKKSHKSARRIALLCSSLAALASGTPYLYGVYSPQLINRCGFSALDSSYLSFSSNIGSSIGGFIAGLIIDKFGIKVGLLLGALLEFSGFFTFYINYKYAIHNFYYLIFAMCSIGFGSVLAYFATIKVATLNFPDHRGLANACPVSAYGLAALFYAFVSTVWFADDVEGLLRFIALFAGLIIAFSSLFIDIYEKDEDEDEDNELGNYQINLDADDDNENQLSNRNEFETGFEYLLKGHRGSFAQVNNLLRNESSSSLFTNVSDVSSTPMSSNSSFRNSSLVSIPNVSLNPISINQSNLKSNSNYALSHISNSYLSSSPLTFKPKQHTMVNSGSFRLGSSINNSPRNSRLFGSMNQKCVKDIKQLPTEESSLLAAGSDAISVPVSASSSPNGSSATIKTTSDLKSQKQLSTNLLATASMVSSTNNNTFNNNAVDTKIMSANSLSELINKSTNSKNHKKIKILSPKEHIIQLFKNKIFISHYILNAFYCSMGQVYIFGIGYIVRAQVNYYREQNTSIILPEVLKLASSITSSTVPTNLAVTYQALQVSIISFSNFLGRLISGPASDLIHKKWKLSKIYVVITSLIFLTLGQLSLLFFNKLDFLSLTSFLIGLSYGSIYGTMPSIVADSFGSKNFATTWSLLGTGPISVFLLLSNYFGVIYDNNSEWKDFNGERIKMCLKGKICYWDVFALNSVSCVFLFIGYMWLVFISNKKK
jgi:MFS family permease